MTILMYVIGSAVDGFPSADDSYCAAKIPAITDILLLQTPTFIFHPHIHKYLPLGPILNVLLNYLLNYSRS
jgi:hypothetical protein